MTDENLTLSDENIDQIIEESKDVESIDEIRHKVESQPTREIVNDKSADDEVNLGELGTHKRANPEDLKDVFEKLPGTIFQLKSCLFRVSYINEGHQRFTAELLNG